MASKKQSRSTTRRTRNSSRKRNSPSKSKQEVKENGIVQDEIILIITLAISILLFIFNLNLGGTLGKIISGLMFGLIGLEAYIMPFAIFFGIAFHLSNYGNRIAGRKILSAIVFLVALSSLIQLLTAAYDPTMNIFDYFLQSQEFRNGGGIIGGIFVMILCGLFDYIAAYVILLAVLIISTIVITGKALFTYLANMSANTLEQRKEYQRLRKEMQDEDFEEGQETLHKRRPPKTFELHSNKMDTAFASDINENDKVRNKKDKNSKKESDNIKELGNKKELSKKDQSVKQDDLPVLNLDYLFDKEIENKIEPDDITDVVLEHAVPTYEEELMNKFGKNEPISGLMESSSNLSLGDSDGNLDKKAMLDQEIINDLKDDFKDDNKITMDSFERGIKKDNNDKPSGNISGNTSSNTSSNTTDVEALDISQIADQKRYEFPPTSLLAAPKAKSVKSNKDNSLKETALKLQSTLESFGVHVTITNVSCGPAVTRYELQPEQGVKVSRITSLADDIKLNLAAADIRIEAPIPGKAAVGIEVPNKENSMVTFRELIESKEFTQHPSDIAFAVGRDIGGQTIITDIAKMPHLLIAGATGSGKSVCINTLIMSILYKSNPSDVRLIMVDPKVVELSVYNGIPHLLIPVVTDPKKASAALNWAVMEMTERYKKFADVGVRDLKGYNEKVAEVAHLGDENYQKLPQIVIIIDELADLMMVAPGEVEDAICRLAQMARAAGLHLIIATQRPSVNVITGLIKANVPSRVAFAVSSAIDSRTILDGAGAEKLLGKGDMLFFPSGYPKPVRIQGAFISDKEVSSVVEFLKKNNREAQYNEDVNDRISNAKAIDNASGNNGGNDRDDYFIEAGKFIIEKDKASIGMLQRIYKIGFNRAARIMDQLAEAGVVGPEEGTKPRKVLMSLEEFEQYIDEY